MAKEIDFFRCPIDSSCCAHEQLAKIIPSHTYQYCMWEFRHCSYKYMYCSHIYMLLVWMSIEVSFCIHTLRKKGRIPLVREKDEWVISASVSQWLYSEPYITSTATLTHSNCHKNKLISVYIFLGFDRENLVLQIVEWQIHEIVFLIAICRIPHAILYSLPS